MRWYIILGWTLLAGTLIGWPVTQLTIAKDEPPFVLALSWLAIGLTAADILVTAYVKRDTDDRP
jgi:hypothetical protein